MSGVWLTPGLRRSEPPHSCANPFEPFQVDADQSDLPFGAVWRCDACGRAWVLENGYGRMEPPRFRVGALPPCWRLASRREVKRALRVVDARGSADGKIPLNPGLGVNRNVKGAVFGRGAVPTKPPPPKLPVAPRARVDENLIGPKRRKSTGPVA